VKSNPELGTKGNLALALVADSLLGPVKIPLIMAIVTKIVAARK
jgi:hypothetical protein